MIAKDDEGWVILTDEEIATGEFDGCPTTGFMWGIKFYIMNDDGSNSGYVEVSNLLYDEENGIPYLKWHPKLLKELLRRAMKPCSSTG